MKKFCSILPFQQYLPHGLMEIIARQAISNIGLAPFPRSANFSLMKKEMIHTDQKLLFSCLPLQCSSLFEREFQTLRTCCHTEWRKASPLKLALNHNLQHHCICLTYCQNFAVGNGKQTSVNKQICYKEVTKEDLSGID